MSEITPEARKVLAQCYAYLLSLPDPDAGETELPEETQAKPPSVVIASNNGPDEASSLPNDETA